mgnify:CR=1|tara:strand:+ start:7435 stop:7611 length:177 start_codon:yes stop_codon:yes gene_type:complete
MPRYTYTFTKDYAGVNMKSKRFFNSPIEYTEDDTDKIALRVFKKHGKKVTLDSWEKID